MTNTKEGGEARPISAPGLSESMELFLWPHRVHVILQEIKGMGAIQK